MKYGKPSHVIPLLNRWYLVITTTGNKYYHNRDTGENTWVLQDSELLQALATLDKDDLVLIIAWCRGLRISKKDYDDVCGRYFILKDEAPVRPEAGERPIELGEELALEQESEKIELGQESEEIELGQESEESADSNGSSEEEEPNRQEPQAAPKEGRGIVLGYGSSDDDSDEEVEDEAEARDNGGDTAIDQEEVVKDEEIEQEVVKDEEIEQEMLKDEEIEHRVPEPVPESDQEHYSDAALSSSEAEGGVDFSLSDLDDDQDAEPDQDAVSDFKSLLEDSQLNPLGSFELQVKSIGQDPRFYAIDDFKTKKLIFDNWSTEKLDQVRQMRGEKEGEEGGDPASGEEVKEQLYLKNSDLEVIDYLNEKYAAELGEKKMYLFEFKRRFKKEVNAFEGFDKIYKQFVVHHFERSYAPRYLDKILSKGTAEGVNTEVSSGADSYYLLLGELGLVGEDTFVKDIKFHCLPVVRKEEIIREYMRGE